MILLMGTTIPIQEVTSVLLPGQCTNYSSSSNFGVALTYFKMVPKTSLCPSNKYEMTALN